jgi:DnaJ family protein C protein 19
MVRASVRPTRTPTLAHARLCAFTHTHATDARRRCALQATPLLAGLSVAAVALTARSALQWYQVYKVTPRLRKFYEGGFEEKMDRREAALILGLRCARRGWCSAFARTMRSRLSPRTSGGFTCARCCARSALTRAAPLLLCRESAAEARVKEAHRKVMQANHPDSGGSDYLATKVNEAKSVMLSGKGGQGGSSSAF